MGSSTITCSFLCSPNAVDSSFNPYSSCRDELSVCNGCVLWSSRAIIPKAGRQTILDELHVSHQGASQMKERARMVVWWPNMDKQIEALASCCVACQTSRNLRTSSGTFISLADSTWIMQDLIYS